MAESQQAEDERQSQKANHLNTICCTPTLRLPMPVRVLFREYAMQAQAQCEGVAMCLMSTFNINSNRWFVSNVNINRSTVSTALATDDDEVLRSFTFFYLGAKRVSINSYVLSFKIRT